MRAVSGVVNVSIVMAAAEGIVSARDSFKLLSYGQIMGKVSAVSNGICKTQIFEC